MEQSSTDLVRVSVAKLNQTTTGRGFLQYVELRRHGTTILRAFIKNTLMLGRPPKEISQSINELLIMFCGPIYSWRLPKVLNLMILEFADIARVGVRSLRFTINNSPRSENIFMWNSKRCRRNANARRSAARSANQALGINT